MDLISFFKKKKSESMSKKKFEKSKEKIENGIIYREICGEQEFRSATTTAKRWLKTLESKKDKLDFINFLMAIIRDDVQTDYMAVIIYYTNIDDLKDARLPFPLEYRDESDKKHSIHCENEIKELDLATDFIIVWPLSLEKIKKSFTILNHHDFKTTDDRQKAFYFRGLDMASVSKGNHSTLTGIGLKKGKIVAREVYDIRKLFPHVDTDGVEWINHHTREIIQSVPDFRFAILYQFARMKYELENED